MFKLSPPVVSSRILAVRGRAKPYYFLNIPTFTTSRLPRDPSSQRWNYVGKKWPMNFAWNARLPCSIQGSFTCCKSTTWDRRLYFPSEGRHAEDFFALKNPTASAGFEPAILGTKGQHATSRPPKPHRSGVDMTYLKVKYQLVQWISCSCILFWNKLIVMIVWLNIKLFKGIL